ncbi:hypothetical protein HC028_18240 [Planosporangium flavigriseum]|uniref:Uncharacterized protein n=1 Tax=Planosporangium flavigriseum TaxID=373681 RepID=A0A8J3PL66_9ACTN|nr:hypothetical protein [Planosporangium flavigriseum]NJC66429.1 hypothetical protein [Planosporangium flavigriseum]GIG74161.1 hypothetical protein Pfl04_25650 [Planosporangium flavigriseum]
MSEEENIRIHDPASGATQKEYDASDLESVLRVREWRNWDEVIQWLRTEGDNHRRLTPGEVRNMVADMERARQRGVQFKPDAQYLWRELKQTVPG